MKDSQRAFPLRGWRVLLAVVLWNALILTDRNVLGYEVIGPLGLVALGATTTVFLTLALSRFPGTWLLRRSELGKPWRWLCLYLAAGTFTLLIGAALELLGLL